MTDINANTQAWQGLDGYNATSTIAVTTAVGVANGTLAVVGDQQKNGINVNPGRPFGEFYVDVYNGGATPVATAVAFGTSNSPNLTGLTVAGGGPYVMAPGERRTFLVPQNTTQILTFSTATTGVVYAPVGKGRA